MLSGALFNYAKVLGFGELHLKIDATQQFCAIIALHSTQPGPAIGGCRFVEYASIELAIQDALRLAQGMSHKAALANLPLGGGKTVLIRPKEIVNRSNYFRTLGRFINDLQGRYITAMDSGVLITDMDSIALETPYVVTTSKYKGDPAPYTALGVLNGMEAAIKFKFNRDTLSQLHVAIQGVGHVGFDLACRLHQRGVKLTVCDTNPALAQRCATQLQAEIVAPEAIYSVPCHIFSPCALGGILNKKTIDQLKTSIVAGAANNQLATENLAELLQKKGILYAPDFVINVGGLIYAYAEYSHCIDNTKVKQQIHAIYETLSSIFKQANTLQHTPLAVAIKMAEEKIYFNKNISAQGNKNVCEALNTHYEN